MDVSWISWILLLISSSSNWASWSFLHWAHAFSLTLRIHLLWKIRQTSYSQWLLRSTQISRSSWYAWDDETIENRPRSCLWLCPNLTQGSNWFGQLMRIHNQSDQTSWENNGNWSCTCQKLLLKINLECKLIESKSW